MVLNTETYNKPELCYKVVHTGAPLIVSFFQSPYSYNTLEYSYRCKIIMSKSAGEGRGEEC